jgi:hypothetical protein
VGTLALILVPAALFVLVVIAVAALGRRGEGDPARPWWGNPAMWIVVSAVSIALGVLVAPRLLGFTFLFLPFVWIGAFGRRRGGDGRGER